MNEALDAWLEAFDDDSLSEGAWFEMLKEGVRFWNKENGTTLDEFQTVMDYLFRKKRVPEPEVVEHDT